MNFSYLCSHEIDGQVFLRRFNGIFPVSPAMFHAGADRSKGSGFFRRTDVFLQGDAGRIVIPGQHRRAYRGQPCRRA